MAQPSEKEIHNEIIKSYRALIDERYQYKNLMIKYNLPVSFDKKRVERFKNYFLENLYPGVEKREELNEAFTSLDDYISHPNKLFRLLLDSASLIFKYGRHLRKIMMAGIKALQSFRKANHFEKQLVKVAMDKNFLPPFDTPKTKALIQNLSPTEIDKFMDSTQDLFTTFQDRVLIRRIKEVIMHLLAKMKKRPKTYSPAEIRGIEIGLEIIEKGDSLFEELSTEEQSIIFDFIEKIERQELEKIFREKEKPEF